MVEARRPVHLAAARAEVQDEPGEAGGGDLPEQASHVVRAGGTLEAVEDEHDGRAGDGRVEPVEIQEVAVFGEQALAAQRRPAESPEERAPDGLEVAAPVPPRRVIPRGLHLLNHRGRDYSWPWSRSFTISG